MEQFGMQNFQIRWCTYAAVLPPICPSRKKHNTEPTKAKQKKAKQRCVMGVGMCLYAQLVQTKNT